MKTKDRLRFGLSDLIASCVIVTVLQKKSNIGICPELFLTGVVRMYKVDKYFRIELLLIVLINMNFSLFAQTLPISDEFNVEHPDFLEHKSFQDLLPVSSDLTLKGYNISDKKNTLQRKGFRRRYTERQWQQAYEEGHDVLLLEQSLLDQFGSPGFPPEIAPKIYKEDVSRRYRIIFFLSFPVTVLYSYSLFTLPNIVSGESVGKLSSSESLAVIGIASILSALIAWYDNGKVEKFKMNSYSFSFDK